MADRARALRDYKLTVEYKHLKLNAPGGVFVVRLPCCWPTFVVRRPSAFRPPPAGARRAAFGRARRAGACLGDVRVGAEPRGLARLAWCCVFTARGVQRGCVQVSHRPPRGVQRRRRLAANLLHLARLLAARRRRDGRAGPPGAVRGVGPGPALRRDGADVPEEDILPQGGLRRRARAL
ncbi:hypothetical protein M885DRAFT_92268 [Pelagophyceae sp. CCMP2097]|nr:hypothetical protein M885DRAFT_92268 [Pelagophyceae sp. CCMP2097]